MGDDHDRPKAAWADERTPRPTASYEVDTPVHGHTSTCDKAGVAADQRQNHSRHIFRLRDTPHWRSAGDRGLQMLRKPGSGVGVGETRRNSVDADIAWAELDGETTNKCFNCAFSDSVGHGTFFGPLGSATGKSDDGAAPALFHSGCHGLTAIEGGLQFAVDLALKFFPRIDRNGCIGNVMLALSTRISMGPSCCCVSRTTRSASLLHGHIALQKKSAAALFFNFTNDLLPSLTILEVIDGNRRAVSSKQAGSGGAHSTAGAGDESNTIL